jgi:hypothetical protein
MHQFSVEIHEFLSSRIRTTEQELERESGSNARAQYLAGRLTELRHARELLAKNYDLRFHKYY